MNLRLISGIALATMLSACASTPAPPPAKAPPAKRPATTAVRPPVKRPPAVMPAPAPGTELERVVGRDARALAQLFGAASSDTREGEARRLQFTGPQCILDAYLYPPTRGKTPVVTYVAARTLDGRDVERNSCIGALRRN